MRKKTLAKLASKLKKLLANSKFRSHLASWRVVISTPEVAVPSALPSVHLRTSDVLAKYRYSAAVVWGGSEGKVG
jgi:hypothetical protein